MTDQIALAIAAIILIEPAALALWRTLRWLWRGVVGLDRRMGVHDGWGEGE